MNESWQNQVFRAYQDGSRVVLELNGRKILEISHQGAMNLAQAIRFQAGKAEEYAKANQIIYDQAIMFRSGAPFGLTAHPEIIKEAMKEAVWNRMLRRSNLGIGGIPSDARVGVPGLLQHPPRRKGNGNEL